MRAKYKYILFLALFLCASVMGYPLMAQTFRRVADVEDLEVGVRYLLAGYNRAANGSVYVLSAQDRTGTALKKRVGHKVFPDDLGRITVDDESTAIFELMAEEDGSYAMRDIALNAWLAYSVSKTTSDYASLYTLTEEELAAMPADSKTAYYKTFKLEKKYFSKTAKTPFYVQEKIYIKSDERSDFGFLCETGDFRLYKKDTMADSLFLYRELVIPKLEQTPEGDWTFSGDWTSSELYALDFSQAQCIDFTAMVLPNGGGLSKERMPKDFVWTYVRKGEAGKLPEGWPNVIEVKSKDAEVQGEAVTPIKGDDNHVLGPKYSFHVPQGMGVSWYRDMKDDTGKYTIGLPFTAERVTWDSPQGESLCYERMQFKKITEEGAVFVPVVEDDEKWIAGKAYLWWPDEPREAKACFYADEATVLTSSEENESSEGFFVTFKRRDVTDENSALFLLDNETGTHFVRLLPGSWIAPCRCFLRCELKENGNLRLIQSEQETCVEMNMIQGDKGTIPVYSLTGIRMGVLNPGESVPAHWPRGVYVTRKGKIMVNP